MFKKNFKDHGMIPTSTFLKTYKLGDIVDIKVGRELCSTDYHSNPCSNDGCVAPRTTLPSTEE
jgi:ribosomal protein L21E